MHLPGYTSSIAHLKLPGLCSTLIYHRLFFKWIECSSPSGCIRIEDKCVFVNPWWGAEMNLEQEITHDSSRGPRDESGDVEIHG